MWNKVIRFVGLVIILFFCITSSFFLYTEKTEDLGEKKFLNFLVTYPKYLENQFYDIRMKLTLDKSKKEENIVLAAITDETLSKLQQRWPLSRATWAKFMDKVKIFGAKVIAYDVFFFEPQSACVGEDPDLEFAEAIKNFQTIPGNKVILPYSLFAEQYEGDNNYFEENPGEIYSYMVDSKLQGGVEVVRRALDKRNFPIRKLLETADPAISFLGENADPDGIYRHSSLVYFNYKDELFFPSFALQAYQYFTGDNPTLTIDKKERILKFKDGSLNLDYYLATKVRWFGGIEQFPLVPIHEILAADDNDEKMKSALSGKLVFVGSTAFGAHDLRHTPIDSKLPGVYLHMNTVKMIQDGKFFKRQDASIVYSMGMIIIGCILMNLVSLLKQPILDLASVLVLIIGFFLLDTYYLLPKGFEISLAFALIGIFGTYLWNTFLNFYLANKDKAFLKNAFGNYISPELIDEMYQSGNSPKLGGDVGVRTAFFTDIQGFSTFSEKLSAPKLVELLNEYLTAMTDILLEEKGTLDKYEGDAIIAFFGAPLPLEDHATSACRVAVRMQEKLAELRKKWTIEGDKWPLVVHEMRMRIGINSGEIVTGNMGSTMRMNYTMMGDSVNLAARLEEAAKQYGIFTQVTQFTKDLTQDQFVWRQLDTIRVVGKSEPVTTYDLICFKENVPEYINELVQYFHLGLDCYKNQKWDEAISHFKKSLECEWKRFPELKGIKTNPSEIYIQRCEKFKQVPPPPNWDGVYSLSSK